MNLKHSEYAGKTVQELLGNDAVITTRRVNIVSSCIAYNNGKGMFTIKPLPYQAQLSSINAFTTADVNGDGFTDIITGGNFYDLLPQFCRIDGTTGLVLLNNKQGSFISISANESGITVKGQVRDIKKINAGNKIHILFLRNDDVPVLYKLQSAAK